MTYRIVCEAWTENARREISGTINNNGEIDIFFSAYGEDYEKGILRKKSNSYAETINFYEEMVNKILQSGEMSFSKLSNSEQKDELIDLNTDFPIGMFLSITDLDNDTKNTSIKCFLQTKSGKWYQLISESGNKQYLAKSSLDELKLILSAAIYKGRFFDAV
ncbi:MAG: hypothetical protein LBT91_01880 [Bifidobacteriaceae bacterium]|jgi:hypothetical protein|nr:hypothetical protein [Bifidobacteriaceae bacterium]